jgi:hypothetical protein
MAGCDYLLEDKNWYAILVFQKIFFFFLYRQILVERGSDKLVFVLRTDPEQAEIFPAKINPKNQ